MITIYKNLEQKTAYEAITPACEKYQADYAVHFVYPYDISYGIGFPFAVIDGVPLDENRACRTIEAIYGGK